MRASTWRANILLIIVTAIWGFGFVAQRTGMQHIGVFTFNALRFGIGCLVLLAMSPLVRKFEPDAPPSGRKEIILASAAAGLLLFAGATLQTAGMATTTAGKAGFITGFYVVLVPVLGLCFRQRTGAATWVGGVLALAGLYLLSVNEAMQIDKGDLMVLASAFFWAAHIQVVGYFSRRVHPLTLSIGQFMVVALVSGAAALLFEQTGPAQLGAAAVAILYSGFIVVAVSYTLQVVAQREALPGHAAVIMVSESMWGFFAGWWLLGETLSPRGLLGCGLMVAGMLLSQAGPYIRLARLKGAEAK
jgi:drug/metabolite transporter (DMT)-like permease